jgi:hypothetical protein
MMRQFLTAGAICLSLSACEPTSGVTTSAGQDRNVLIVNNSNSSIVRFYGSNVGTNSWEEDILGTGILPIGRSVRINFDDGSGYCNFDFKIEFSDGSTVIQNNINVCTVGTYTIS